MRIRSIKPEFWRSDDIDRLDWETRLLFVGLWSYVDDNGVGRDRESDICADLFSGDMSRHPLDTLARVAEGLATLAAGGLIERYTVDGKPYLHISTWTRHQRIDRPNKARYPLPTCANAEPRETLATPSRHPRETPAHGAVEQWSSGAVEVTTLSGKPDEPDPFVEFWKHYPRKTQKRDAEKAYRRALKRADAGTILDGLRRYPFKTDPTFIPQAERWLNGDRWADEPELTIVTPPVGAAWTEEQLTAVLGPDKWRVPQPPSDLSPDERWEWTNQQRITHRQDRIRQAIAKQQQQQGGVA